MAIIRKRNNIKKYIGLLTPEEIKKSNEMLEILQSEIPKIESELSDRYQNTLEYKYYLGEYLSNFIGKSNIKPKERLYFWKMIEEFASENNNPKSETNQRHFYEYCYRIFSFGYETAFSLSYREWNDLLARKKILQDVRIIKWFKLRNKEKARFSWRNFLPTLNKYLEKKDTMIFTDEELFTIYEKIAFIGDSFEKLEKKYLSKDKSNLTEGRRRNYSNFKKKYIAYCISIMNEQNFNFSYFEKEFKKLFLVD